MFSKRLKKPQKNRPHQRPFKQKLTRDSTCNKPLVTIKAFAQRRNCTIKVNKTTFTGWMFQIIFLCCQSSSLTASIFLRLLSLSLFSEHPSPRVAVLCIDSGSADRLNFHHLKCPGSKDLDTPTQNPLWSALYLGTAV